VVVWLHVVAAVVWVGGLMYASHLVLPEVARGERRYIALLTRGRVIGWGAIGLLVVTGLENLRQMGLSPWLGAKLLLVIGLLALAAHRDFALLPRAAGAIEAGGDSASALAGVRRLDRLVVVLALVVLFLAAGVARGR